MWAILTGTSSALKKKSGKEFQYMFSHPETGSGRTENRGVTLELVSIVKPRENPFFLKNGKMVISVKIQKNFRSRMTKRTSPLESSREI